MSGGSVAHICRRMGRLIGLATVLAAGACELVQTGPRQDLAEWPKLPVVDAMLRLANTTPEDIVYDLGPAEGLVPIVAAERFDVRLGVGVESDPETIRAAESQARAQGVEHRVQFIRSSASRVDLSEATVVTLFAGGDAPAELRPLLLKELRPGTRVVAYGGDMDDWHPDREAPALPGPNAAATAGKAQRIALWVVPGEAAGEWKWATGPGTSFAMRLNQRFQIVTGEVDIGRGAVPIREGRLSGPRLRFEVFDREGERDIVVRFDARVDGGAMRGTVTLDGRSVPFSALRLK